jgi:hypothetical protein
MAISPFNPDYDLLGMVGNDYTNNIVGTAVGGVLTITNPGTMALSAAQWNEVINYPAYRLNLDVSIVFGLSSGYALLFSLELVVGITVE